MNSRLFNIVKERMGTGWKFLEQERKENASNLSDLRRDEDNVAPTIFLHIG